MILALALAGSVAMPKPAGVPASCPVTTVERWSSSTNSEYPFVRVQPTLTGMWFSFQSKPIGVPGSAYAPLRARGTLVVWHVNGNSTAQLNGTMIGGSGTMTRVQPVFEDGSELTFPAAGCWRVRVSSGVRSGDVVVWVVP